MRLANIDPGGPCLHTNRKQEVTESDDYISDAAPTPPECSCVLNSDGGEFK